MVYQREQWEYLFSRHGDMLYLAEKKPSTAGADQVPMVMVEEEQVDCDLAALDGKIQRTRDPQL